MKQFAFGGAMVLVLFCVLASNLFVASCQANQLELVVKPQKETYQVGELPFLDFVLTNKGDQDVLILNSLRADEGFLTVRISKDGRIFEKYDHRKWGTGDSMRITTLKPNESTINKAWVFYNSKPRFSDSVTPEIAQRESLCQKLWN